MISFTWTLIALSIIQSQIAIAQDSLRQVINVANATEFFTSVCAELAVPERGDFETVEEYENRIPSLDTNTVYYFQLASSDDLLKSYEYDLKAQRLCIGGGETGILFESTYGMAKSQYSLVIGELLQLNSEMRILGEYQGTNAFGATVTISKHSTTVRTVDIANWKKIPRKVKNWKASNGMIWPYCMCVDLAREEAELLAHDFDLLIGLRLMNNSICRTCDDYLEPSFSRPVETRWHQFWLSMNCEELVLRKKSSSELVSSLSFKPKKKSNKDLD